MTGSRLAKTFRLAGAIAAVVVVAIVVGVLIVTVVFGRSDRICRGVSIAGVHVGGMTRVQADTVIRGWAASRLNERITLTALDKRWIGTFAQLAVRIDTARSVAAAVAVGRTGNLFSRAWCVVGPGARGIDITPVVDVDRGKAEHSIRLMAKQVDRSHVNAKMRAVAGRLQVVPESCGLRVDQAKAFAELVDAARKDRVTIGLPVVVDRPEVSAADGARITTLLARYATPFNPGKVDRTHNLTLASKTISGIIIKPGGRFSYNTVVGPRLMSKGYRNAPIFVKGKLEPGLGGGACQVSSTIYNAVLLAGLRIVERNHHSRTVPYVRPGRDATVAYGLLDFRFENSGSSPICVLMHIGSGRLTADIYGAPEDRKTVRIFTSSPKYVAAGSKTVVDGTVPPGQVKVLDHGSPGVSVTVYREIKSADGSVSKEVVSRDRYPAQSEIKAIGRSAEAAPKSVSAPAST